MKAKTADLLLKNLVMTSALLIRRFKARRYLRSFRPQPSVSDRISDRPKPRDFTTIDGFRICFFKGSE
jgi:hypothetical protein